MHPEWVDQLSSYLDDELDPPARRRVEAHLAQCASCARVYGDLVEIVRAAKDYAGVLPPSDLWPGIAGGIEASRVLEFKPIRPGRSARWLPIGLAAAAVLAAGLGGTWWYRTRPGSVPAPAPAVVAEGRSIGRAETVAVTAMVPGAAYSAAVADLERTLATNRSKLDTTTVRIVEESLRTIDRAIAEAQTAIQRDTANAYLNDQIAANMRRKIALLRLAARAASKET